MFLSSADLKKQQNQQLFENFFQEYIMYMRMLNSLHPEVARRFVVPALGLNCFKMLSAGKKSYTFSHRHVSTTRGTGGRPTCLINKNLIDCNWQGCIPTCVHE